MFYLLLSWQFSVSCHIDFGRSGVSTERSLQLQMCGFVPAQLYTLATYIYLTRRNRYLSRQKYTTSYFSNPIQLFTS